MLEEPLTVPILGNTGFSRPDKRTPSNKKNRSLWWRIRPPFVQGRLSCVDSKEAATAGKRKAHVMKMVPAPKSQPTDCITVISISPFQEDHTFLKSILSRSEAY